MLVFFLLVTTGSVYFAAQLEPDAEAPQMFPDDNNYQKFGDDQKAYFGSAANQLIDNEIVFGIKGIDRDGTDYTVPDDYGKVIFDGNFSFMSPAEQLYLAQICDDLVCGFTDNIDCRYNEWADLKIAEPANDEESTVRCFMTEFRDWIYANPQKSNLTQAQILNITLTLNVSDLNTSISA